VLLLLLELFGVCEERGVCGCSFDAASFFAVVVEFVLMLEGRLDGGIIPSQCVGKFLLLVIN